jgi:hypothetical protein
MRTLLLVAVLPVMLLAPPADAQEPDTRPTTASDPTPASVQAAQRDPHVAVLQNGRFEVTIDFEYDDFDTGDPVKRRARVVPVHLGDHSVLFYFFNAPNVEALVKILDAGCQYWVFASVLSDLGFRITVRDLDWYTRDTGGPEMKVYTHERNPGHVPPGVIDLRAFRC